MRSRGLQPLEKEHVEFLRKYKRFYKENDRVVAVIVSRLRKEIVLKKVELVQESIRSDLVLFEVVYTIQKNAFLSILEHNCFVLGLLSYLSNYRLIPVQYVLVVLLLEK